MDDMPKTEREAALESGSGSRAWALCLGLAAALGVALRLRALLAGRSLWLDEAMLALNICGRDFAGLLRPLDYDQGAPIGFLLVERLLVLILGPTELALRLVPFAASLATLVLVARFCRVHFGNWAAVVGLGLAAVSPSLIAYAGEGKQYSIDVAAGLLILNLAGDALRLGLTARRAIGLAVAGAVAVWFSHPAPFVLAGAGTTLILHEAHARRVRPALLGVGASTIWLASFAVSYVLTLRDLQSNSYLLTFWEGGFLPLVPRSVRDVRQYVVVFLGLFEAVYQNTQLEDNLAERMEVIAAAAWLAGVVVLYRKGQRGVLTLLVTPLIFAAIGAMLHKYPLRFRLALFTCGPTLLTTAAGLAYLFRSESGTSRATGRVLAAVLALLPTMQAAQFLIDRPPPYGARSVLEQIARQWRPGDTLLVDGGSGPPFRFYQKYGRIPGLDRIVPTDCDWEMGNPVALVPELPALRDQPRVWLLVSAHLRDPGGRQAQLVRVTLDQWGRRLDSATARGYYAHLYDFRSGTGRAPSITARY